MQYIHGPPQARVPLLLFGVVSGIALTASLQFIYNSFFRSKAPFSDQNSAGNRPATDRLLPSYKSSDDADCQACVLRRQSNDSLKSATMEQNLSCHLTKTSIQSRDLDKLERDFTISSADLQRMVRAFIRDMEKGLASEGNVLKMIPSYINKRPTGGETGSFLALDVGGSNFRVCQFRLLGAGEVRSLFKKYVIPESLKIGSADDLFDFFATCIEEFMNGHKIQTQINMKLGFTFSFPIKQVSINAGELFHWTKGFTTSGVVGQDVVELLQSALKRKRIHVDVVAIINDTVGTLISHAYTDPSTHMGIILGTGNNAAYVEKVKHITKWKSSGFDPEDDMIINIEWGAWGSDSEVLPTTSFDRKIDKASPNPRQQLYEKMISGLYLGELTRYILLELIGAGAILGGRTPVTLSSPHSFDTAMMSRIERDYSANLDDLESMLRDDYKVNYSSLEDRRAIQRVVQLVGLRAARMAAIGVAAVTTKTNKLDGCTIAIDGSVFEHYPHFGNRMRDALREIMGVAADNIILAQARDGSGQGAALTAALF